MPLYWTPNHPARTPDAIAADINRSRRLIDATSLRIWLLCHPDDHVRQEMEPISVLADLTKYAIVNATDPARAFAMFGEYPSAVDEAAGQARKLWTRASRLLAYMEAAQLDPRPIGAYRVQVLL
jgi:hypothetical protein